MSTNAAALMFCMIMQGEELMDEWGLNEASLPADKMLKRDSEQVRYTHTALFGHKYTRVYIDL